MRVRVRLRPDGANDGLLVGDPPEPAMPTGPVDEEKETSDLLALASAPLTLYPPVR